MELARAEARLVELRLRVLVAADRNQVGADSGATSTPAWLAHATKTTRTAAFRDLHLAEKLDDRFHATRRALAAGVDRRREGAGGDRRGGRAHRRARRPPRRHPGAGPRRTCSTSPRSSTPRRCGSWASGCSRWSAPRLPTRPRAASWRRRRPRPGRWRTSRSATTATAPAPGTFKLPTLHADLLKKALEALTSPRRIGEGRLDPETGKKLPHATLLGHGLMELVENHLSDLPSVNGSPFTLVVTIGYDALVSGIGVAVTDTGCRISAGEARRLACRAGIIPVVLGGDSMPLDVGREQRLFDRYQKIAINHRYERLRRPQLRQATRVDRVPPPGPLAPGRQHGCEEGHLAVPTAPPDGRPPPDLRPDPTPQRQDPLHPTPIGRPGGHRVGARAGVVTIRRPTAWPGWLWPLADVDSPAVG